MGELWETRVQSVASQHVSLSLSARLPPTSSISVSLLAENHRRLHADHILRPQMIWENRPCFMPCVHLNPVQLFRGHSLCLRPLRLCECVLPPHSLWRGPSPSWSPGCPGESSPAGRDEFLPPTG